MTSHAADFQRACSVTAAHFVTLDFTELTDEHELLSRGFLLEDRARGESIKIFSLVELEQGVVYCTPRGTSLIRTSRAEALLADKITLPVDFCEARNIGCRCQSNEFTLVGIFRGTRRLTDFLERSGID